mmetsp:Transcript_11721/g.38540  ORF Transcript_11721/g.38540 Transcript_11721/m.38540 type:complete len:265 (+) Transcript_11721:559-1353(+)
MGTLPASMASTLFSTSCAIQSVRSCISRRHWNVAGALRSRMLFCEPRARAWSSPMVTVVMPPRRSLRHGFLMTFSSTWPWAVATRRTPRSAMLRHAITSASVPISSTMITSGVWFWIASTITSCCSVGTATCMRRALPMAGCGTSPSPPISFEVSTMTTRFLRSSLSTRAISRITVVLPTPGRPRKRSDSSVERRSRIISTWPVTARPTRHVKPTITPRRFRMHEMRWSVFSIPARLSSPNIPTADSATAKSSHVTSSSRRYSL